MSIGNILCCVRRRRFFRVFFVLSNNCEVSAWSARLQCFYQRFLHSRSVSRQGRALGGARYETLFGHGNRADSRGWWCLTNGSARRTRRPKVGQLPWVCILQFSCSFRRLFSRYGIWHPAGGGVHPTVWYEILCRYHRISMSNRGGFEHAHTIPYDG